MHPYVLIPLLSTVGAGALASAITAREPDRRANRLVGLILLCAGFWSLCQVLWNTTGDPGVALRFARWSSLGSLLVGPASFHLLVIVQPRLMPRFRHLLSFTYAAALVFACAAVTTPWHVESVLPTLWGWAPVLGPAVPFAYASVIAGPLTAVIHWLRTEGRSSRRNRQHSPWLELAAAIPLLVASLTEFALPLLGIHVPRLGSASIVVWGGLTFWTAYRFRGPILDPRLFAHEILETLPDGVALLRPDGRIRATNRVFGELAGCRSHQLMGRPIAELIPEIPGGASSSGLENECELVGVSSRRVPVSISQSELRDDEGDTIGHVLVVRDLREVASLRSRLVTSGRLAAVGQLAAGIAHEINNPIAFVRSNLKLLARHWEVVSAELEKSPRGPLTRSLLGDGRELIRESGEGVDRVASIVRDVGGFSHGGPAEKEMGQLNELLDTAVRVAAPQLRHRANIERRYAELPPVPCRPQELMQVFLNLLLNAAHSIDGQGTIRLDTEAEGEFVVVRIEDDGRGIAPELLERIFDPFFTTKPVGEGTGLGLAISRQIVASHGGEMFVSSQPGLGTKFGVRLPAGCKDHAEAARERS